LVDSSSGNGLPRKATRHRLLIGCLISLGALAAQAAAPQTVKLAMEAQKDFFREKCFTLEAGQQLTYRLSTRHPIEFNLHHHRSDGAMVYPDRLVVSSQHSKQFIAESAGGYCFMATNLKDQSDAFEVVISYEIAAQ
jgi:hypothetical protein